MNPHGREMTLVTVDDTCNSHLRWLLIQAANYISADRRRLLLMIDEMVTRACELRKRKQ